MYPGKIEMFLGVFPFFSIQILFWSIIHWVLSILGVEITIMQYFFDPRPKKKIPFESKSK